MPVTIVITGEDDTVIDHLTNIARSMSMLTSLDISIEVAESVDEYIPSEQDLADLEEFDRELNTGVLKEDTKCEAEVVYEDEIFEEFIEAIPESIKPLLRKYYSSELITYEKRIVLKAVTANPHTAGIDYFMFRRLKSSNYILEFGIEAFKEVVKAVFDTLESDAIKDRVKLLLNYGFALPSIGKSIDLDVDDMTRLMEGKYYPYLFNAWTAIYGQKTLDTLGVELYKQKFDERDKKFTFKPRKRVTPDIPIDKSVDDIRLVFDKLSDKDKTDPHILLKAIRASGMCMKTIASELDVCYTTIFNAISDGIISGKLIKHINEKLGTAYVVPKQKRVRKK